jgi:predicted tellurium resistance membrane protein TerC
MTEALIPLISLILLEVILGIDNIIFISILTDRLPESDRKKMRFWGIGLAMIMRMGLLTFISWILKLDHRLFSVADKEISGKGLILIAGGLFLLYKTTKEIYHKTEQANDEGSNQIKTLNARRILSEIILLDLVFSIDSIITAVGMVKELWVMYVAVVVTVVIMLMASKSISDFIRRHPSFKILALCFLMMIGVSLIAEGLHFEIPKGYIYFAMAFSFFVDLIQMRTEKKK